MAELVFLGFLALIGPLSYFYGVDSRLPSDRGWFPDRR